MRIVSIVVLILFVLVLVVSCVAAPTFDWKPALWATDSKTQTVSRSGKVIKTSDPAFDEMLCVHKSEPRKAVEACERIIQKCSAWKD